MEVKTFPIVHRSVHQDHLPSTINVQKIRKNLNSLFNSRLPIAVKNINGYIVIEKSEIYSQGPVYKEGNGARLERHLTIYTKRRHSRQECAS